MRGPLQDPAGAALRAGRGRAPRSGRRQGARTRWSRSTRGWAATRIWRASWTCRSSGSSPIRRAGRVPAAAGPAGRRASCASSRGRARPGSSCWNCCPTDAEALESLARIFNSQADWPRWSGSWSGRCRWPRSPAAPSSSACSAPRSSTRSCTTPTQAAQALEQLDRRDRPAQRRRLPAPAQLLRGRRGLAARRQGRRAAAVPDRGPGVARAGARWSWARWSATSWATTRRRSRSSSACWRWTPTTWRRCTRVADLYVKTGDHQRLAFADEKLLERESDPDERRVLMLRDRGAVRDASGRCRRAASSGTGARTWRRPTPRACSSSIRPAERHGLFEELIQIYEGARARAGEPMEQLAASLKIALICEEKLRDPARAFATLCDALPADPAGRELLPNLERLAEQTKDWRGLLDVYARVARARTEAGGACRAAAAARRGARAQMVDPSGALDEMLRSFALAARQPVDAGGDPAPGARRPGAGKRRSGSRATCSRWPRRCPRSWRSRATPPTWSSTRSRICVRAFRAYLNAFRLAPEDAEIVGHLWRLAAQHRHAITTAARPRCPPRRRRCASRARRRGERRRDADDDAAGATSDEDDDIDVDVDDDDGRDRGRRGASGERRGPHADAATPDRRRRRDSVAPPPVAVDELDRTPAAAIRADDAIVEEEAAEEAGDADVIEELDAEDAELLEATPPPHADRARPPPRRRSAARPSEPKKISRSRRPGRSWPTRTTRSPPRTPTRAASTCARSSRCGSSDRRTSTARWARWSGPSGLDIKDEEIRAELRARRRPVRPLGPRRRDLPGRHRRVRPDRHGGGAAPRRRAPARAPRPDGQGGGAVRRDPAPQVRRRGRAGARRGDLPRAAALGRPGQRAREADQRADRGAAARARAPASGLRELATLYEERLERPYEAIDTLERLLVRGGRRGAEPRRGGDARRERRDAAARTRRWRACTRASACGARSSTA